MNEDAYAKYGMTPEQLHAGIDRLWMALEITGVQAVDVFTQSADKIRELRSEIKTLEVLNKELTRLSEILKPPYYEKYWEDPEWIKRNK